MGPCENEVVKRGKGAGVITLDVTANPAVGHRPHEDRFVGAEIISRIGFGGLGVELVAELRQVEHGGSEMADRAAPLVGQVVRHRQGLQIDLRAGDRRADVEENAAFEPRGRLAIDQEVGVGGAPMAAPSQLGCSWMMSEPMPTCTVTGTFRRTPAASTLSWR